MSAYSGLDHFSEPMSALMSSRKSSSNKRPRELVEDSPSRKTIRYFALSDNERPFSPSNRIAGSLLSTGDLLFSLESAEGAVEVFLHSNFIENIDVPRSQTKMISKSFRNIKPIAKFSSHIQSSVGSAAVSSAVLGDDYRIIVFATPSTLTSFATLVCALVSNGDGKILHIQKHDIQMMSSDERIVSVLCIGNY